MIALLSAIITDLVCITNCYDDFLGVSSLFSLFSLIQRPLMPTDLLLLGNLFLKNNLRDLTLEGILHTKNSAFIEKLCRKCRTSNGSILRLRDFNVDQSFHIAAETIYLMCAEVPRNISEL